MNKLLSYTPEPFKTIGPTGVSSPANTLETESTEWETELWRRRSPPRVERSPARPARVSRPPFRHPPSRGGSPSIFPEPRLPFVPLLPDLLRFPVNPIASVGWTDYPWVDRPPQSDGLPGDGDSDQAGLVSGHVEQLQDCLNRALGLRLPVNGQLNAVTRAAIRLFQERQGLPVTGLAGPETERALLEACQTVSAQTDEFASEWSQETKVANQAKPAAANTAYRPSPTRSQFELAVAGGDWQKAFLNLNGLNMFEMLRALVGLSGERRNALMRQREAFRNLVNMPRIEYAWTVVQTRQLPDTAPGDLEATGQVQTAREFLQQPSHTCADWTKVSRADRMRYVMRRLIQQYGFPENAAAGLVGNLLAESQVLPNIIEGGNVNNPMTAPNFEGRMVRFTALQIMQRDSRRRIGPIFPGVGLAQWTTSDRRSRLFRYVYRGKQLGENILFDMDAQIDYLVNELRGGGYRYVHTVLMNPRVSVDSASDEVVYGFEIPGAVYDATTRTRLPRSHPNVQAVFRQRRQYAAEALRALRQGG